MAEKQEGSLDARVLATEPHAEELITTAGADKALRKQKLTEARETLKVAAAFLGVFVVPPLYHFGVGLYRGVTEIPFSNGDRGGNLFPEHMGGLEYAAIATAIPPTLAPLVLEEKSGCGMGITLLGSLPGLYLFGYATGRMVQSWL